MQGCMLRCFLLCLAISLFSAPALAGEADVLEVKIDALGDGKYRFHVTVEHADDGWDHYADGWQVVGPDGNVLGTRELAHPHVEENPFTRSHVITVPEGVAEVTVRARDLVHGLGGEEVTVRLPQN